MKKRLLFVILPFLVLSAASPFLTEETQSYPLSVLKKKKKVQEKRDSIFFLSEYVPTEDSLVFKKLQKQVTKLQRYSHYTALRIKKAHKWFPLIEGVLKKAGLPEDFKYLVVVESNFKNLTSPKGAVGFWQFMPRTAQTLGLKVNEFVDERLDPIKSTYAAALYFSKGYARLGNFTNVAASYNMGISGFKRAMEDQGKDNYFKLRLNRETAQYLYKALAFKIVYENQKKYGFDVPETFYTGFTPTRDLVLKGEIDLRELARQEGIKYSALIDFNPWYKRSTFMPDNPEENYIVRIPVNKAPYAIPKTTAPADVDIVHVVKQNESLIGIANQYDVDLNQLMAWNELTSEKLELGQKLGIYITTNKN